jgi:hypothetical protein
MFAFSEMSGNRAVVPKLDFLHQVKLNAGKHISNFEICRTIATANNMVAVEVAGAAGNCQYDAIIAGLKAVNYIQSFTA